MKAQLKYLENSIFWRSSTNVMQSLLLLPFLLDCKYINKLWFKLLYFQNAESTVNRSSANTNDQVRKFISLDNNVWIDIIFGLLSHTAVSSGGMISATGHPLWLNDHCLWLKYCWKLLQPTKPHHLYLVKFTLTFYMSRL